MWVISLLPNPAPSPAAAGLWEELWLTIQGCCSRSEAAGRSPALRLRADLMKSRHAEDRC
jgi:hypothetical protein